ncbi:MAG TPA: NAD-dependent epimerase/dehydratase family protein [Candidatus Limnocylindria bacterium]|nr:NAD-dependent epimerase/dehydratase family protein [Candidatus Limnocylindria bacterium]
MPRVLITGITGFAGSHLAERALARGHDVAGFALDPPPYRNLAAVADRVRMSRGDVADAAAVRATILAFRPDVVLHLAGQAVPSLAARDVGAAVRANVEGTAGVVAALAGQPGVTLVVASSAEVYGASAGGALREDAPLRPPNVYAATKVAAETVARSRADGVTVVLRPANQVGPRLHPMLVASAFARQVAAAEAGIGPATIRHGRLDARREFTDVRDMADAYLAAAGLRESGTYNVSSEQVVPIARVLEILTGFARVPVRTELDPERLRAGDPEVFRLDASAFRARTGWAPHVPLERSLSDLLDWWREEIRREVPANA